MEGSSADPGVAPRAISELFRIISDLSGEWTYKINFSVLEIYNENIYDLLTTNREKLDIRQTPEGNAVPGLTEVTVSGFTPPCRIL